MANEFALNLQDASLNPATWALPTQVGEANGKKSAAVDLGADTFKNARYEVELSIPALSDTIAPAGSTAGVAYEIWTTTSSTLDTTVAGAKLVAKRIYVGTGSGVVATVLRGRVASDSPRYLCGKVWLGTTCTDASAVSATLTLRF
jgi:hypothetical protein